MEIKEIFNYCFDDKFNIDDIENRHLYINQIIDRDSVDTIAYHIFRYNRLDRDLSVEERKPIIIYINCDGGSLTDGYVLIDAIMQSKTPVYTVAIGVAYSMAFLVFIAGDKRYSMPNATFLCHDGSSMALDSLNKLKDRVEFETGQMENHIENYVINQTKITQEEYDKNRRKEWYFYPEEGKELGVVTHIIGVDAELDDIV